MIYCDGCNACTDEVGEHLGMILCLDCANLLQIEDGREFLERIGMGVCDE